VPASWKMTTIITELLRTPSAGAELILAVVWIACTSVSLQRSDETLAKSRASLWPVYGAGFLASGGYFGMMISLCAPSASVWSLPRELAPLVLSVAAAGGLLRIWAVLANRQFYRGWAVGIEPMDVVRTGPYRLCRHPGYLGAVVMLCSSAALALSRQTIACAATGCVGYLGLAVYEEKRLL